MNKWSWITVEDVGAASERNDTININENKSQHMQNFIAIEHFCVWHDPAA